MGFDVAGLGQCTMDQLAVVETYPPVDVKAETSPFQMQGGGPVATALVALSRLGRRTVFLGKVGDDPYGPAIRDGLLAENVDVGGLVVGSGLSSQTAFIAVERGTGRRTIFWTRGSAHPLRPEEVRSDLIRGSRFLHLDGLHLAASLAAAQTARAAGIPTMLDTGTFREETRELLPLIDHLVVGSGFAQGFLGRDDPEAALPALARFGARLVCVTLGTGGCLAMAGDRIFRQPAFVVTPVDTTGCGDAFHGGLIHALLEDWPVARCLVWASAVAALKTRAMGGRAGLPNRSEVEAFLSARERPA